jgi:hypothetical protein
MMQERRDWWCREKSNCRSDVVKTRGNGREVQKVFEGLGHYKVPTHCPKMVAAK